jgi:menaquinone-dependent protoporphyrinogen IX oxidase
MEKRDFLKTGLLAIGTLLIPRKTMALDFYPTTSNVEWAVLYGTWCGSARDAGVWISEGMNGIADVFDVRENPDLSKYKHIIVGGAIRSNAVSPELRKYLTTHKEMLKDKIKGLFAVCGNMQQAIGEAQYNTLIVNHLARITGAENYKSKIFLGRVTFGLMEEDVRKQMQSAPGSVEYDNLKRTECLDFGKEVLQSVS